MNIKPFEKRWKKLCDYHKPLDFDWMLERMNKERITIVGKSYKLLKSKECPNCERKGNVYRSTYDGGYFCIICMQPLYFDKEEK